MVVVAYENSDEEANSHSDSDWRKRRMMWMRKRVEVLHKDFADVEEWRKRKRRRMLLLVLVVEREV